MSLIIENNVNINSDSEYEDCESQELLEGTKIKKDDDLNPDIDLNEDDNIIIFIKNKFLTNYYIKNNIYSGYIVDKEFIKYCTRWSLNRDINYLHWQSLYNNFKVQIEEHSYLILPNIISVAFYENNYFIIDGQHRIKAIQELNKKYIFDCKFRLDVYYPKDYEEMLDILSIINYSKPLDIEHILNKTINDILTFMKTKFTNGKTNIFRIKKCQRPLINEFDFVKKLKECKFIISQKKTSLIINKIIKINDIYQDFNTDKLKFDNKRNVTSNMIIKAGEYDCFLGFDTEFNWLDQVNNELEKKLKSKKINVSI